MSLRDLIPWSRQENRLPVPVHAEPEREQNGYPLASLHREVNRLFDDVMRGFGTSPLAGLGRFIDYPRIELSETDKDIRVTAELPGMDEKDVDLTVEDGVLTLRGEKKAETEDKDRGYSERSYGRFERRIHLPKGVELDQTKANFRNGVLSVTLPRKQGSEEGVRRIAINHG